MGRRHLPGIGEADILPVGRILRQKITRNIEQKIAKAAKINLILRDLRDLLFHLL